MAATSAEFEMLREALLAFADEKSRESVLPSDSCTVEKLLELAAFHGVSLATARVLNNKDTLLAEEPRQSIALGLTIRGELLRILAAFEEQLIPVLCIKGPALAELAYPEGKARDYSDLDLLVQPGDRADALRLLSQLGYVPKNPLTPAQQESEFKTQHAIVLRRKQNVMELDLHWALIEKQYALPGALKSLWSRAIEVRIEERYVKTMSAEDALIWGCIHGSKDLWLQLKYLLDIRMIVDNADLDWNYIQTYTLHPELGRFLAVPFLLSVKLLSAKIPASIQERWDQDATLQAIAKSIEHQLRTGRPYSALDFARINLRLRKRPAAKFRYVLGRMCIPHDSDWDVNVPDRLFALYYLIKPLRTLLLGVRAVLNR